MEEISPVDSTSFLRVSSLSFLTACLMDFGCTQLTFTIMEVNFFPQYLSVHLSICLSIHPPYYIFFSAGPLTDILSLEVRATVEFTRVCRHECWLFLMYPPDAISTFLHLVWPETLHSPLYSGCTQYFWQQTRGPKENEVQVTPSPASWLLDVSPCKQALTAPVPSTCTSMFREHHGSLILLQ